MKIALYSPYLDTAGGGEKYILTLAEVVARSHNVDLLLDKHLASFDSGRLKDNLAKRFNLNLDKIRLVEAPLGKGSSFIKRLFFLHTYDLLISLTNGSIFYSTAKRNILHIQSPLVGQPADSFWGKIKLLSWEGIIYNSKFTKENAEKFWRRKSRIIYPPVDVESIKSSAKKKKIILSVGRFFGYLKEKKHELMIDIFADLQKLKEFKGWSLVLVGAAAEGDMQYVDHLQRKAVGMEIKIYPNLSYKELIRLYGEASIYWHAMGYGESDVTKMEHFGIATVEAMAGGCVPVVIGKGGQCEIVENGKSGFFWSDLDEFKELTIKVVNDEALMRKMGLEAVERSKKFSKENFERKIEMLVNNKP